jgi:hypothetical protein
MAAFDILVAAGGHWVATPWDYNSLIGVRFGPDGSGDMVFGYGQTIYAKVSFRFSLSPFGELTLTYQDSPGQGYVKAFRPSKERNSKTVRYSLKEGDVEGVTVNSGPYKYQWTLGLDDSPFPGELKLPDITRYGNSKFSPPREYFGAPGNSPASVRSWR